MAEAIAIAAPRTEEVTETMAVGAGAGITGLMQGVIVRVAPQMGAAAPMLTWGSLIGAPTLGVFGALFTRGMLGNVFRGVAAGGIGVLCYSLPEMISPAVGRRAIGGGGVKLLGAGIAGAPARAAAAVGAGVRAGWIPEAIR